MKIIDFGVAAKKKTDKGAILGLEGRPLYVSPEMVAVQAYNE